MTFSPDEIETAHFLVALRGYDKDQVDAFLKAVADDYRTALRAAEGRRADPADEAFRELGQRVELIARGAVEAADRLQADAEAEAGRVRGEAEAEAASVRAAARAEPRVAAAA